MRKIVSMLLIAMMCCGLLTGCAKPKVQKLGPADNSEEVVGENEALNIEEDNAEESDMIASDNNVLPHNREIKLSDTKDIISSKETLVKNEYGIEGLWDSSETWHVENSDYQISYNFFEDGTLRYVSYILVDSSLSDMELGFTEVTTKGELRKLYGDGEQSWEINNDGKTCKVTLERNDKDHSIILNFINH